MAAVPQDVQVMAEEGQGPAGHRQFGSLELEGQPSSLPAGGRACLLQPVLPFSAAQLLADRITQELQASAVLHLCPTPSL